MRAFPVAVRGLAILLVAAVFTAAPVRADDPTVAQLEAELATAQASLDEWYAKSAAASERLNGATFDEAQASSALRHSQKEARRAALRVSAQREAVAELTVQQVQQPAGWAQWSALAHSSGAAQLLERSAAYASTQEGMTALLDALDAQQVVLDAATGRAEEARAAGRAAQKRQRQAQAELDAAVRAAENEVARAAQRRNALIDAMAREQGITRDEAADLQELGDEPSDTQNPDPPASPTTPAPTTPAPTTPAPEEPPPPPASTSKVETAIAFAMEQLGEAYQWGGAGPSAWDCSGLTMRAWQAAGVSLAHYAGAQYSATKPVAVASMRRGDLLFWSDGGPSSIYHVSMYLGGGQMIHAPRPGRTVEIVPLTYWIAPDLASRPG